MDDESVIALDEVDKPSQKKISPPLLKNGNGGSRPHKNDKRLKPPKGIHQASVEYTILNKIHNLSIQSTGRNAAAVASAILEHYNTAKTPEDFEAIVQKYMDSGYIELQENSEGTFDLLVNSALVNGQAIESLKFDYNRRITVEIDSKDIKGFDIEDLILTRILQMETYRSSGVPQEKALKDFIFLAGREAKEGIETIMARLRDGGYIEPNGDDSMHLSKDGLHHIMRTLHKVDSLIISNAEPPEEESPEDKIQVRPIEEFYRDMGAVILTRPKSFFTSPPETIYPSKPHDIVGNHIPPQHDLSDETISLLERLESAIEQLDIKNNEGLWGDIDKGQTLLSLGNKQEAEALVDKLSILLNQASPQTVGVWHVSACLTERTSGYIPLSFVRQMPYDVEAMMGSRGQIAHGYELRVIGNSMAINFNKNLTLGDVMSIISISRDLEAINIKTQRRFENPKGEFKRESIMHSGLNGVVYIGNGRIALFPDFIREAKGSSQKLDYIIS